MAKRVIVKPGDIFYVTIKGKYRRYFQYIVRDKNCFNADLIRVFTRKYDIHSSHTVEEILEDKVAFYTHTVISAGIFYGYWEKYGKGTLPPESEWSNIIFGSADGGTTCDIYVVNGEYKRNVPCPAIKVENGNLSSADIIKERIETGIDIYFLKNHPKESRQRFLQCPFPDAEICVVRKEKRWHLFGGFMNTYHYYKFLGENVSEEVVICDGKRTVLTLDNPKQNGFILSEKKLSDVYWDDPVPECEYEAARIGQWKEYVNKRTSISRQIEKLIMENYFLDDDLNKFKCGKLYVDIIPCGFRLWLEIVRKRSKEVVVTDSIDVEIPMQTLEFVSWLWSIVRSTRKSYCKQMGYPKCSFVEVYMNDSKRPGVYRDFEAEGFKF